MNKKGKGPVGRGRGAVGRVEGPARGRRQGSLSGRVIGIDTFTKLSKNKFN